MDKYFICLANSYKRGGRCIAGVEVLVNQDDHSKMTIGRLFGIKTDRLIGFVPLTSIQSMVRS